MRLHREARRSAEVKAMRPRRAGLARLPTIELVDRLPQFVDEIVATLHPGSRSSAAALVPEESTTAAEHGTQRLRLGFSVDAVVSEYDALRDALIATVLDAGIQPEVAELQLVFDCIISGIAHAVSEYTYQRDAEPRAGERALRVRRARDPESADLGLDGFPAARCRDPRARDPSHRGTCRPDTCPQSSLGGTCISVRAHSSTDNS
jgi:hypothetical protein